MGLEGSLMNKPGSVSTVDADEGWLCLVRDAITGAWLTRPCCTIRTQERGQRRKNGEEFG